MKRPLPPEVGLRSNIVTRCVKPLTTEQPVGKTNASGLFSTVLFCLCNPPPSILILGFNKGAHTHTQAHTYTHTQVPFSFAYIESLKIACGMGFDQLLFLNI